MSIVQWMNLLTTPIAMLKPELFPPPGYIFWSIELFFLCDILRKCTTPKPKSITDDIFDIFIEYAQTNLILDLLSIVPVTFSGLNPDFTFFKIIRVYEIDILHFPFVILYRIIKRNAPESQKQVLALSVGTICKILILLHYLSCMWVYLGSAAYMDYEEGYLPWQFANDDFIGLDFW